MTKINGTEEKELLQMIIRRIRPPPCSSVPLQMVICKEDGSPDDQSQGIVANDHPENPASPVPLQMVVFKEDLMIRPPPSSSVPFMVICKEDGPPVDQHCFGRMGLKFAPDLPLVWRILNTKFQLKRTNRSGVI